VDLMRARRGVEPLRQLCSGPGKLTQALAIELHDNRADLLRGPLLISDRPTAWRDVRIAADPRIGITRAAELPWRFSAADSRFLSRPVRQPPAGVR
jgi:DNA-3-methyladenine glycosylase